VHALVRESVVTARVTTLKGADAGAYYVDGPGGYYLDGDEPPGRWLGRGAEMLGLSGEVDDEDFLAVVDGIDPVGGALLGTRHTGRTVRGFDVTCSAPKSVSVLFAVGDEDVRREVLDAHDAAVTAALGWIEDHAHCRYRVDGEIWTVDADGLIAAAFRQHTSRAHDPQIHTHLVIANRVAAPDGRWLALDARTLKRDQRTMSALYAAGLRAELTTRLGVRWKVVENGLAEMADAPKAVLAEFSERTEQMKARRDEKLERFVDQIGRQPTRRERWALEREAAVDSRPTKTSADAADVRRRWCEQLEDLGFTPERYTAQVTDRIEPLEPDDAMDRTAVADALSSLRDMQSVWRPAEITREIAAVFPTGLGTTAAEIVERAERLASHAEDTLVVDISKPIPDGVPLRRDGRPVTEGAVDRMLTTQAILDEEERILTLAQRWTDDGGDSADADARDLDAAEELTAVQRHAAGAVAGERRVVLVVGPAGTGKTTALRPAVAHLHARGRPCFGVAPSAAAAEVLAVETGIDADTLDKLLIEHRLDRRPQHRYDLPAGATVVVDVAAMVPTPRLAELVDLADRRGWRLALVGDPMQFAAVGRSGMFGHLVDTLGAVELDRVHRFAASWERDASLRLRRGDTDVVDLYDQHGRLHGGTARQMARATVRAWRRATDAGETAAMMAPTRDAVAVLNEIAQRTRIAAGEIDPASRSVRAGTGRVHAGDLVATRRNERNLRTDQSRMVKNRDRWTVDTVHEDGALTVTGATGRVVLPAGYVAAAVELAYAETSHATQGRTVDRSFLYLDGPTDTRGIYVPLTRGRTTNEAFVVLHDEQTAAEVVADAVARTWVDQPATALRQDLDRPAGGTPDGGQDLLPEAGPGTQEPLPPAELRTLVGHVAAAQTALRLLQQRVRDCDRTVAPLTAGDAQLEESILATRARLDRATTVIHLYDRPLRRRGHRDEVRQARVDLRDVPDRIDDLMAQQAVLARSLVEERNAQRLLGEQAAAPTRNADRLRRALDSDAAVRGRDAADGPDFLLVARLGAPPADGDERERWILAAGRITQHQTLWPAEEGSLLGPYPSPGEAEYSATFYAANQALADLGHRPQGPEPEVASRELGRSL
jgi:conjugative relaxase-like TrwC/TraI family protein